MHGKPKKIVLELHTLNHKTVSAKAIKTETAQQLLSQLYTWQIIESSPPCLNKQFAFDNYQTTLNFVNAVAKIAEKHNHHPKISFGWNQCSVDFHTHDCNDLSLKDFLCAYKIDQLLRD